MSDVRHHLERLLGAGTKGDVLDALWELRDSAYDRPEAWQGLTAEHLFQALAEQVDGAAISAIDWNAFAGLLSAGLAAATSPPGPKTP